MENIGCQDESVENYQTFPCSESLFTVDLPEHICIQTWFDFRLGSMEKGYMAHNPARLCTTVYLFQFAFYQLSAFYHLGSPYFVL